MKVLKFGNPNRIEQNTSFEYLQLQLHHCKLHKPKTVPMTSVEIITQFSELKQTGLSLSLSCKYCTNCQKNNGLCKAEFSFLSLSLLYLYCPQSKAFNVAEALHDMDPNYPLNLFNYLFYFFSRSFKRF